MPKLSSFGTRNSSWLIARGGGLTSNASTLQSFNPSTLQPFNPSTLQPFNPSTLQPFNPSTLQPFNPSTLRTTPRYLPPASPPNRSRASPEINAPRFFRLKASVDAHTKSA